MKYTGLLVACVILLFTFFLSHPFAQINDYDGNILPLAYIADSIKKYNVLPEWMPFINQGIPIPGDPLNSYLNPIVTLSFLMLPPEQAVKIITLICMVLAGIAMMFFLKSLNVERKISYILALTYISSGYFASRIMAGHLEKILTYPLLPFFLMFLLNAVKKRSFTYIVLTALSMTGILLSGDIYNLLYGILLILSLIPFFYFTKRSSIKIPLLILILFFCFSAIKLFPLIEIQSFIHKNKEPFKGSQTVLGILLYLFIPLKQLRLPLDFVRFINTDFGWWERISYIGPLSLFLNIYVFFNKNIRKKSIFLLFFLIIFIFISMPNAVFNPMHYFISKSPQLQLFHVPSRVFAFITIIILALTGIGATKIIERNNILSKFIYFFLIINFISVALFFIEILHHPILGYKPHQESYIKNLDKISQNNPKKYMIAEPYPLSPLPLYEVYKRNQFLLRTNYGLMLRHSPAVTSTMLSNPYIPNPFIDVMPGYFLTEKDIPINPFLVHHVNTLDTQEETMIYTFNQPVPFSSAGAAMIRPNKISVTADIDDPFLTIRQSWYPGWKVFIDGKKMELEQSRFLSVKTLQGKHTYTFVYSSRWFRYGVIVSFASLVICFFILKKSKGDIKEIHF